MRIGFFERRHGTRRRQATAGKAASPAAPQAGSITGMQAGSITGIK
jgi:hypothetical protein